MIKLLVTSGFLAISFIGSTALASAPATSDEYILKLTDSAQILRQMIILKNKASYLHHLKEHYVEEYLSKDGILSHGIDLQRKKMSENIYKHHNELRENLTAYILAVKVKITSCTYYAKLESDELHYLNEIGLSLFTDQMNVIYGMLLGMADGLMVPVSTLKSIDE